MDERRVAFYFDFISPYGWMAAERIGAMCRDADRDLDWNPFLLKATVVDTMGQKPLLETPLKGDYLKHDCRRMTRLYGLTMADDPVFTFSSLGAARLTTWAKQRHPDQVEALVLALYRRHWSEGGDISRADELVAVADRVGLDGCAGIEAIADQGFKDRFRRSVDATIARGVFGSPTIIVDGEMFWGADRLEQARRWMQDGGW